MGSPVSVVIAEIVMQNIEESALSTCRQGIPLWLRHRRPKLQLWDDHLAQQQPWRNYKSLYGNIYERFKELKKYVKFSIKIPHLTSTAYRLLSDRLFYNQFSELFIWRFLHVHNKSPRLSTPFPNARSEKRKVPAQNDRAATNPTQNPSKHTVVSFQLITN